MKLYEIESEFDKAIELYESAQTQEEIEAAEEALMLTSTQIERKCEGIGFVIKRFEAEQDLLDKEIVRLGTKKAAIERQIEWLKRNVSGAMKHAGIEKIKTPLRTIYFMKTKRVEIEDESKVPDRYKVVTTHITKTKIKADWDHGIGVEGTKIIESESLVIK